MPSINMIAPRRADKLRRERDMRRLVFVIMAEMIVAVALAGWVVFDVHSMKTEAQSLQKQIDQLQPIVNEINQYNTATTKLQPKLKLLNDAMSITMRWYNTLSKLTQSMPASTYLVKVASTEDNTSSSNKGDDTQRKVLISGVSSTQTLVGETMLRIQSIPDITDVQLHFTRSATVPDYQQIMVNGRLSDNPRQTMGYEFEIGSQLKLSDAKGAKKDGESQS
jgi:Tfp pilus assembly protein PilN